MSDQKTETPAENTADQYQEALENVKTLKSTAAEAKAALRKFKKANKVRTVEKITDEKIKAEFIALELAVTTAQTAWEEAKDAADALKPAKKRGGGGSYAYGQIKDTESGAMRDLESTEKKRWRTHARKLAKKEEGAIAAEIPFDPTYFDPKPAKKKAEKAEPKAEAKPKRRRAKKEE